jgi:hypothetical protein
VFALGFLELALASFLSFLFQYLPLILGVGILGGIVKFCQNV